MRGAMIISLRRHLKATAVLAACLTVAALAACERPVVGSASLSDTREPLALSAKEREHLRLGMRTYLESTQGIVDALAQRKTSLVAEQARKSGMGAVSDVSLTVAAKLPPQFILLSADTHQKFDDLSLAAARSGNKGEVLQHLRDILANCTACHAMYRISTE